MKGTVYLLLGVAITSFLSGCFNKSRTEIEPEPKIPINISPSASTKATDDAFETNDIVGIYIVNADETPLKTIGNHADNVSFTLNGGKWLSDEQLFWKNPNTNADFYCYYPYKTTIEDITNIPVSVNTNQSTLDGLKSSFLLWGAKKDVKPTSDPVVIKTAHTMSNLIVKLKPGLGYTQESFAKEKKSIKINNLKVSGFIDLRTGTITASGNASDITPYAEKDYYRALVIPQTINDATLVSLTIGEYSFSIKETISFKSSTQHTVTLTVNKITEGINIGIIGWENDENDYGGTVN